MYVKGWSIYLMNREGLRLTSLDRCLSLDFVRVVNGVGAFTLEMPSDFDVNLLRSDYRVEMWRLFPGGAPAMMFAGLITEFEFRTDSNGRTSIWIYGDCINALLTRRVIIQDLGSGGPA